MESQKPHKHRLRDSERLLNKKGEIITKYKNRICCMQEFIEPQENKVDIIEKVAKEIYGADGVTYDDAATRELQHIEQMGFGNFPVCIAKTQYSLSDNPKLLGRPENFTINVREAYVDAGAGFVVILTGKILTMPGLPTHPAAENINYDEVKELEPLKGYIMSKDVWIVGGDGWSYDIGFGGIDHIMASGEDVNILVLDTEVYSNTGGQASKSTEKGAVAKFANDGKKTSKKDLARMMMGYPNVYVAQISLGANMNQAIKALRDAGSHKGPSLVIAYSPCINHGIKKGMGNSIEEERLAVKSGYFPIFRYDGEKEEFTLDFKSPDFDLYDNFLDGENRYTMIKTVSPKLAKELLTENKKEAIKRFEYYKNLSN